MFQILFMIKGILGSFQVYGFILNFKDNYYRRGTGNYYYNYNNYLEKSDLTVVFGIDIAASCVPVYANQTWSFLHMILSTGPQPLVNLRTSSIYCALSICSIHFMCIDLLPFHIEIEHLCHTDCFVAFILLGLL